MDASLSRDTDIPLGGETKWSAYKVTTTKYARQIVLASARPFLPLKPIFSRPNLSHDAFIVRSLIGVIYYNDDH